EGMAAGDVVNTAARLQAAAPVNGILVGERTFRATRATIEYRAADPVAAKGKREPAPVWEAAAARARPGGGVPVGAPAGLGVQEADCTTGWPGCGPGALPNWSRSSACRGSASPGWYTSCRGWSTPTPS